jgi:hypothetical protein
MTSEGVLQLSWAVLYVINSLIVWLGPFFIDINSGFYVANLCFAMMVGIFGIMTFFFPFIVGSILVDEYRRRKLCGSRTEGV